MEFEKYEDNEEISVVEKEYLEIFDPNIYKKN